MSRFTRREWKTLALIGVVFTAAGFCYSLPPPFYPHEAASKGVTATEYGLVFGIYEFVGLAISPILGKYMNFLGAVFLLRGGVFVAGISIIIFGMLHLVNMHATFIGLSFTIRIIASLGASSLLTSSFSIFAANFQDRLATISATLEVLYGLGTVVGPIAGGLLLTLGGYMVPFLTVGVFLLGMGWLIVCILPPLNDGDPGPKQQLQVWSFLRLTPVLLDLFAAAAANIGTGFYSAILEPHLQQFGLTALSTGGVFTISAIVYSVTAPLTGRLCDKYVSPRKVIVVGGFLGILSFALVGPLPYTGLPSILWMCCLGLGLHGLSKACLQVPAFVDCIRSAVEQGLPNDITTYGMVSGLYMSSIGLGAFIGSSVAGILFDQVGFRIGTLFPIGTHLLQMLLMVAFICKRRQPVEHAAGLAGSRNSGLYEEVRVKS